MKELPQKEKDSLLIDRCKHGDEAAFDEIVHTYWDKIFGRAFQMLKNPEDAEEITQDTFIRALRNLKNFRGDSSLSTWLYQIATNLSYNRYWYWKRRKIQRTISIDEPLRSYQAPTLKNFLASDNETPENAVTRRDLDQNIKDTIEGLSDDHRNILTLRNLQDLSYEEIAQELHISIGTVKSRIARARKALKNKLNLALKMEKE